MGERAGKVLSRSSNIIQRKNIHSMTKMNKLVNNEVVLIKGVKNESTNKVVLEGSNNLHKDLSECPRGLLRRVNQVHEVSNHAQWGESL